MTALEKAYRKFSESFEHRLPDPISWVDRNPPPPAIDTEKSREPVTYRLLKARTLQPRKLLGKFNKFYVPKIYKTLPGEMQLKVWLIEEAQRLGVSENSVRHRFSDGKYPDLKVRRVNSRVIFVRPK